VRRRSGGIIATTNPQRAHESDGHAEIDANLAESISEILKRAAITSAMVPPGWRTWRATWGLPGMRGRPSETPA
jgi:hypothetical protein